MKGSINPKIAFPAISINETGYWILKSAKDLTTANKSFLNSFTSDSNVDEILDYDGNLYKIEDVRPIGYTNIFFGISLRSLGRSYYVDTKLKIIKRMTSDELQLLFNKIKSHIEFEDRFFPETENSAGNSEDIATRDKLIESIFFLVDPGFGRYL